MTVSTQLLNVTSNKVTAAHESRVASYTYPYYYYTSHNKT